MKYILFGFLLLFSMTHAMEQKYTLQSSPKKNTVFISTQHKLLDSVINLLDRIDNNASVWLNLFQCTSEDFINKLIELKLRGVTINIILDQSSAQNYPNPIEKLLNNGIDCFIYASEDKSINHFKNFSWSYTKNGIKHYQTWIGSLNPTYLGNSVNNEIMSFNSDKEIFQDNVSIFNQVKENCTPYSVWKHCGNMIDVLQNPNKKKLATTPVKKLISSLNYDLNGIIADRIKINDEEITKAEYIVDMYTYNDWQITRAFKRILNSTKVSVKFLIDKITTKNKEAIKQLNELKELGAIIKVYYSDHEKGKHHNKVILRHLIFKDATELYTVLISTGNLVHNSNEKDNNSLYIQKNNKEEYMKLLNNYTSIANNATDYASDLTSTNKRKIEFSKLDMSLPTNKQKLFNSLS